MNLPQGIIYLDYNHKHRLFHFDDNPNDYRRKDWNQLKAMSYNDAIEFCTFMDKKYVDNKKEGILPELSIVKMELDLFFALKTSRRKLSGRY